jgi:GT2 family glycosyltransferase
MGKHLRKPRAEVSVLIPVHNAAGTLDAALRSVLDQKGPSFEVIVVLNGCTDTSPELAKSWASRDSRVKLIEYGEANLVKALNRGLDACCGPMVARMDADDLMAPNRLKEQQHALVSHPDWAVVSGTVTYSPLPGSDYGHGMARHVDWLNTLRTPDDIAYGRFIDSPVAHPSVMFRTQVIRQVGAYHEGDFPEDHELWLRLVQNGYMIGKTDASAVIWQDHGSRLTRTDPRYSEDANRALRHAYLLAGPLAQGQRRCRIWGAGKFGKRHARELVALGAQVDALIDIDPRKVGGRAAGGIPVISAEDVGPPDDRLIILAVGAPGARSIIEDFLTKSGHQRERDFIPLQ